MIQNDTPLSSTSSTPQSVSKQTQRGRIGKPSEAGTQGGRIGKAAEALARKAGEESARQEQLEVHLASLSVSNTFVNLFFMRKLITTATSV